MARRSKGRDVNGIVLLDKPLHLSSNQALQKVKGIFYAAKAGHTGALDPLATGMLPICLGEGTKYSQFLLDADKTYVTTATLGIRTTTCDADGEVVERKPVEISEQQLVSACEGFTGPIKQVPSMFSALKHQGKPLYHYARQGIEIDRPARDITIYELTLLAFDGINAQLRVRCSKGTYIRSLVDDIGQVLGCGAYVSALHRSGVADYPVERMVNLAQLQQWRDEINEADDGNWHKLDECLLPIDTAVRSLPECFCDDLQTQKLRQGQIIQHTGDCDVVGLVRLYLQDGSGEFIGVGERAADGRVSAKRLVATA